MGGTDPGKTDGSAGGIGGTYGGGTGGVKNVGSMCAVRVCR
jgi:hypothetical protein